IGLRPRDSILIHNCADLILSHAIQEIVGKAIDRKVVKGRGSIDEFQFLYSDAKSRDELAQRIRVHPGVQRACEYYERLVVLSPKNPAGYRALVKIYSATDDVPSLERLAKQLGDTKVDHRSRRDEDPIERDRMRRDVKLYLSTYQKTVDDARKI